MIPALNQWHRWTLHRMLQWLLPLVMMVGVLAALLAERKAAGVSAFIEDRAFADMAVARTLVVNGQYGLQPGVPCPAARDTLWRLVIALAGWLTGSVRAAALLVGALCAVGAFLLALKIARALFPFPPFLLYASVLWIVAPGLLTDAISGTSQPLATVLVMAACWAQMEGLRGRRSVLSLGTAALVGLLVWIRLEFLWLWIVFWGQAVFRPLSREEKRDARAIAVVRGLSGLLLIALMLFPLIVWNLRLISVPWPPTVGAPMTLNAWASRPLGETAARNLGFALRAYPALLGPAAGVPLLQTVTGRLFIGFGVGLMMVLSLKRGAESFSLLIPLLLVLLPLGPALFSPYTGPDSGTVVVGAAGPLFLLAAAFGLFRLPFALENLYRKWKPGLPEATGFDLWWTIVGGLLLLVALIRMGQGVARSSVERMDKMYGRQFVLDVMFSGREIPRCVATDEPGWLAFIQAVPLLDLGGEFSPGLLYARGPDGRWGKEDLIDFFAEEPADLLVLWKPENEYLLEWLGGHALPPPPLRRLRPPVVRQISPPAAF